MLTTTAVEDETSEGNPENRKRDAVDVAPSVPAHEDKPAAEPSPENKAAAVVTAVETPRDRRRVASLLFRDCTAIVLRMHGGDGGATAVLVRCYGGHGGVAAVLRR